MKHPRVARAAVAAAVVAAGALGVASPASAAVAPSGCTYSRTLSTDYIYWSGAKAASVKQMYGTCSGQPRNWTYVWVWDSFASGHDNFWTEGAIRVAGSTSNQGWVVSDYDQQELNSNAVATTTYCTTAFAKLHWGGSSATVSQPTQVC